MTTAVVTGGGRGIGRAIALRLARDGHAVAVNDVNKAGAESVAEEITAAGGRAVAVPADVTDRDAVFAMVDRVATELGSVDIMVANEKMGPYLGNARGETLAQYTGLIALGRVQTPEDVAGFVSYLAGPDADYMTGQSVMIDGGIVMV
jgi:NAD(P)-dependent dehydrogenase (short-subunit alcohol dehydrogenase family)